MKYLIVGLGNVGEKYKNTRHNIGFSILDVFSDASNVVFEDKRYGFRAEFKFKGRTFVLLKPSTFMNLSGKAVRYWLKKEKLPEENLLIITDDVALPFGQLRLRSKGGDAGHNGLNNIIELLGTSSFSRLRFGIGSDYHPGQQAEYVLSNWTEAEKKVLPKRIDTCVEIIKSFGTLGVNRTMNLYNNK